MSHCKICGNKKLKKVIRLNEQYISATFVESNKTNAYIDNILKKKKIVLAFDKAEKKGLSVVSLGSKMIDPPVVKRALHIIDLSVSTGLVPKNWKRN